MKQYEKPTIEILELELSDNILIASGIIQDNNDWSDFDETF